MNAFRWLLALGGVALLPRLHSAEPSWNFATQILPILTKSGCNTGACHGAATGQGGFSLSLLGYDAVYDYAAITHALDGRRIDLADPVRSLLLRKATRTIKHKGGRKFSVDSANYTTLRQWIAAGAPTGSPALAVSGLQVEPADLLLKSPGDSAPLRVTASLSDGSTVDVTALALYDSQDDAVAEISSEGVVKMLRRGASSVMIRFGGQVAAVRAAVPFQADEVPLDFTPVNFIDEHIAAELRRLHLPASPLSSASTFLRRVHLDVAGRLPTEAEARAFHSMADANAAREAVITRLIGSTDFVDVWTMRLADVLLISSKKQGVEGARVYHDWLHAQIARNTPLNDVVKALLTGQGDTTHEGPANFYRLTTDPRDMGEFVSRSLLGVRLACARCHHHPFDRWGMDDYYSFAGWFSQTGLAGTRVILKDRGEVEHPQTRKPMLPRALGAPSSTELPSDRREALAAWTVHADNPFFARALVNRVWKHLMGRGLVEPVDDLRASNPASMPELLNALAADLIRHDFDLRHLVRVIVTSRAYQLASSATGVNRLDDCFGSHARVKALTGPVLADALSQAMGTRFLPSEMRAVQMHDPALESYTLDVLGRCPRSDECGNPAQFGGGLSQALHLLNGEDINRSLRESVAQQLQQGVDTAALIESFYLRSLSRMPTGEERAHWLAHAAQTKEKAAFGEDLLWALLNSREYAFIH
ncbi:MAG: DUF1549 and DUF1553 domain-containing protein [Prosthecobacter sp.]|uniref:DUF1549 domain-containing protein n=1 Tax=Prosthecobacter sp. TaxID=1965333 RepID=UPI0025EBDAF8|nr:DUF1549 domain-containing protein [Prosthecobacter sp.]MCF7785090.1 DUF1549 and DUF1553 domain-containing protein [Prosthecobacter sp.]